jgi:hypothetical protein
MGKTEGSLLNEMIGTGIAQRYEELGAKVAELAGLLSDEQFWRKPFTFGNSFGHLVLHLTGNLNYYIGTEVAGTGYVRDRDREFNEAARPPKDEVLKRFADAVAMVAQTARVQAEKDWSAAYSALREETAGNRFNVFLRCATHLHHHVGQMTYLQSALTEGAGSKL